MSADAKRRPQAPGHNDRGGEAGDAAASGTQLEMNFASEVSGASWAEQRAHNEVIDSLVDRLRRQGL